MKLTTHTPFPVRPIHAPRLTGMEKAEGGSDRKLETVPKAQGEGPHPWLKPSGPSVSAWPLPRHRRLLVSVKCHLTHSPSPFFFSFPGWKQIGWFILLLSQLIRKREVTQGPNPLLNTSFSMAHPHIHFIERHRNDSNSTKKPILHLLFHVLRIHYACQLSKFLKLSQLRAEVGFKDRLPNKMW